MSVNGNNTKNYGAKYNNTALVPDVENVSITLGEYTLDSKVAGITSHGLQNLLPSIQTIRTLGGILYHQSAPDVKRFSITFVAGSEVHNIINNLIYDRISNHAKIFDVTISDSLGNLHKFSECMLDNISDITGNVDSFGEYTATFIAKSYYLLPTT